MCPRAATARSLGGRSRVASNKRAQTGAPARMPNPSPPADDLDLGMDEDELEALFAQALESTSRTVKVTPSRKPPADDFDLDDLKIGDEDSIHIHIDDSEDLREDIARLFGAPAKRVPEDGDDLRLPPLDDDDDNDFGLPEADDILATLDGFDDARATAKTTGDESGGFDELDRELQAALDDDDDAEEDILQAAMERLLAESFGVSDRQPGEDISLPEIPQEDGDDEILALGDDGAISIGDLKDAEIGSLRAQVSELARALTVKDLEIRTQEDRIDGLEQQMVAATRQAAGIGREFESFRRRAEREKEDLKKFAAEKTLKEFLTVFDNLDRAIQHAGADRTTGLGQGVEMILGQFSAALRRCGAQEVPSGVGETFDPQWHEAVGQEYSDELAAGEIAKQLVAGFQLNGRLLRAAMVSVSRGPAPAAEPEEEATEAEVAEPGSPDQTEALAPRGSKKSKKDAAIERASAADDEPSSDETADAGEVGADEAPAEVQSMPGGDGDDTADAGEQDPPAKKKRRRRKKAPEIGAEE